MTHVCKELSRPSSFHELLPALSSNVIIFKPHHRVLSLKHSCRLTPILAMGKRSLLNGGYLLFLIYVILYYILYRPLLFTTPRANILQECLKLSWHQQFTISNTSPQRAKLLLILCFIQFLYSVMFYKYKGPHKHIRVWHCWNWALLEFGRVLENGTNASPRQHDSFHLQILHLIARHCMVIFPFNTSRASRLCLTCLTSP